MTEALSYDAFASRAEPWLVPVSEAAPTGDNARFDPRYEALAQEVGKLDALTGGPVAWPRVVADGGVFLTGVSKDLLVAAYVAHGLLRTQGLAGLATGSVLLAELLGRYWDRLWPDLKRLRGRVNALVWFVEWTERAFPEAVTEADRVPLDQLTVILPRLSEIVRERFQDAAPAIGPLREKVERLKMSLPAPQSEAPATTVAPVPGSAVSAPLAVATPAPAAAPPAVTIPVGTPGDFVGSLRQFGEALQGAAATARRSNLRDPAAYRSLRTALYLHMAGAPPAGAGGKTGIPPMPDNLRAQIQAMRANGKIADALEESESALERHRFVLDLHRTSAECLAELGAEYAEARKALVVEVTSLLRRMPELTRLQAANGSPLADDRTLAWVDAEILPASRPSPGATLVAAGAPDSDEAELQTEATKRVGEGKLDDALAFLSMKSRTEGSARARFLARLIMAEVAMGAGQPALARAVYETLDSELEERGLGDWEPVLAARCLEGHLRCLRALGRTKTSVESAMVAVIYDRLCRLDPVAALRAGS